MKFLALISIFLLLAAAIVEARYMMSPKEAIQKLRETEDRLLKKSEFLEKKIETELQTAKKYVIKNKRAALSALKRKKRLEKQQGEVDDFLTTIEFKREALEQAQSNTQIIQNMAYVAMALKKAHNSLDVDKVDDLMADIQEPQEVAHEIADAIAKPMKFQDDVNEDDLLTELEEMEKEEHYAKWLQEFLNQAYWTVRHYCNT